MELAQRAPVNCLMFSWRPVMSGVLQRSGFGPVLFSIFGWRCGRWVECTFRKFADDTRLNDAVDTQSSTERRECVGCGNPKWGYRLGNERIERACMCWWMKHWEWAGNVCLQPRKPSRSWAASKAAWAGDWGMGLCLSALGRPHQSAASCSEFPAQDRHGPAWTDPEEGHRDYRGLEAVPIKTG